MKTRYLVLLITGLYTLSLSAQQQDTSRTDTIPATQNWTPREPLSPEVQQRRADKAAELEAMRQRFRSYQNTQQAEAEQQATKAANNDYLWSDAETPRPAKTATIDTARSVPPAAPNTENLRLEIGRNLWVKGETTQPPTPREQPAAYDALPPTAPPADWEAEWEAERVTDTPPAERPAPNEAPQTPIPTNDWQHRWQSKGEPPAAEPAAEPAADWALDLGQKPPSTSTSTTYSAGTILPLSAVFSAGGSTLATTPQPDLDKWIQAFSAQPNLKIEIRAHAHVTFSTTEADTRSTQRAQAIADYFLERGVASARLQIRGYGKRAPLNFDRSPEGQLQNERVEVIVLQQ